MGNVTTTEDPPELVIAKPERFWSLRIVFFKGQAAPDALWLRLDTTREITVGRDPSVVSFIVADPTVSAVHARLRFHGGVWQVQDEKSRHGTCVNGRLIHEWTTLGDNSVVSLGHVLAVVGKDGVVSHGQPLGGLSGTSYTSRLLFQELRSAAGEDGTIILAGPTGAGKSSCARAIHFESTRKQHPFLEFSCADVNENMIESELFGHKAGAFTGASTTREGRFVAAGKGTLFLDEIAELPLHLQTKLLWALQTKTVLPVGSDMPVPFEARIIVATHRNLDDEVAAGRFREDLYHRIAGRPSIKVPSAAERKVDLVHLVAKLLGDDHWFFTFQLVNAVLLHAWTGNIRELSRFITDGVKPRQHNDDPHALEKLTDFTAPYLPLADITKEELVALLIRCNGNISAVARAAGCHRRTIDRKLKQWNLSAADYVKVKPS